MNKKPEKPQYVLLLKVGYTYDEFRIPIREGEAIKLRFIKVPTLEELAE